MNQKVLHKVFIWGFLFLYFLVALISFCHAVQFFGIGNVKWMSVSLAFSFELGLALSLASILLSEENKKQTLPWILMITLTAVQVIGNVYSVFKYISLSNEDYYQYLAKPLLFFIEEVDENTIQVIVSWIMGAILPVVALMMTDMVANNIKNVSKDNDDIEITKAPEQLEQAKSESSKDVSIEKSLQKEEKVKTPILQSPKIEEPVKEQTKEVHNAPVKEDEDNIANYVDVLTPTKEKRTEKKEASPKKEDSYTKKANILNIIPGGLFKKKKTSEPYFRDPIVNHEQEQ